MAQCSDYEGRYTVTQSSCSSGCAINPDDELEVVCSPTMRFLLNGTPHDAQVNSMDQLEVPGLDLFASVTGVAPLRFLFGTAQGNDGMDSNGKEVWGAEEG